MKLNNLNNKRPSLEDLIWKGSLLPNKYQFAIRNEIRSELQKLDERWTKLKKAFSERVDHFNSLHSDWLSCGNALVSIETWLEKNLTIVQKEEDLKCRNGAQLNIYLQLFEV